jgi:hypothetical protein
MKSDRSGWSRSKTAKSNLEMEEYSFDPRKRDNAEDTDRGKSFKVGSLDNYIPEKPDPIQTKNTQNKEIIKFSIKKPKIDPINIKPKQSNFEFSPKQQSKTKGTKIQEKLSGINDVMPYSPIPESVEYNQQTPNSNSPRKKKIKIKPITPPPSKNKNLKKPKKIEIKQNPVKKKLEKIKEEKLDIGNLKFYKEENSMILSRKEDVTEDFEDTVIFDNKIISASQSKLSGLPSIAEKLKGKNFFENWKVGRNLVNPDLENRTQKLN